MSSKNYWREREERQRKQNIKNEAEHQKKLDDIYANMLDNIEKEINGFYVKYAKAEGKGKVYGRTTNAGEGT